MSRVISNEKAAELGLRGRASYQDGGRVKKIAKEVTPQDPVVSSISAMTQSVDDMSRMANATVLSAVQLIKQSNTDLFSSIEKVLTANKNGKLEKWKFKVGRDSSGRLSDIDADQIR